MKISCFWKYSLQQILLQVVEFSGINSQIYMPSDMIITIWKSLQECLPLLPILFFLIHWSFLNLFHKQGEASETETSEFQYLARKDIPKLITLPGRCFSVRHQKIQPFLSLAPALWMEETKRVNSHAGKQSSHILMFLVQLLESWLLT